jgi:hypothetical protein
MPCENGIVHLIISASTTVNQEKKDVRQRNAHDPERRQGSESLEEMYREGRAACQRETGLRKVGLTSVMVEFGGIHI